MAECSLCGAITTQTLELTWLEGWMACSNCEIITSLGAEVLDALNQQAVDARATLHRLKS